ncbi:MAG: hypothetical protein RIA63_01060, partial [Cyclobacteriaceae bacterium]
KRIAISLLILLLVFLLGGYVFFEVKFTPPPNYLTLSSSNANIPITWTASKHSEIASLLLPVKIDGVPNQFYMQFDTGSPKTLFYKNRLASIQARYPDQVPAMDSLSATTRQSFKLGDMQVSSEIFNVLDIGSAIDWSDTTKINVIGTIGSDMIEKKITIMNFKEGYIRFVDEIPEPYSNAELMDFSFVKRKTLFPATVGGKQCKLLHDTGTSGFELITSKEIWEKMAKKKALPVPAFEVNSWGRTLTAYNIASDQAIDFNMARVDLGEVTYIEGASFMQVALMRMTGMGGMIGNKVFTNKILILDCINRKYTILD